MLHQSLQNWGWSK